MKILWIILYLPIKLLLFVMSRAGIFPSFYQSLLASSEYGAEYGLATQAYDAGKYEDAYLRLKKLADIEPKTDFPPEAAIVSCSCYYLACMAFHGKGMQVDYEVMFMYMRKAAALGYDEAVEYMNEYEKKPNQEDSPD
jgi:hypothetical protein